MNENDPLVSIILPVYNTPVEYLRDSISSILNQTYSNIELIIADDSTDLQIIEFIDDFASKDDRINVIRHKEKKGLCYSLNEAIKKSRGSYVARMDADDISMPSRIEHQLAAFTSDSIGVVGGKKENFGDVVSKGPSPLPYLSPDQIKESFKFGKNVIINPASIVRREALLKVGGYEELYECAEDFDLWYKLALVCDFVNIDEVVLHYRIHSSNLHVMKANPQSELCCVSQIKYALGIARCLSAGEFNVLKKIVEHNLLCRLNVHIRKGKSLLAKFFLKYHLDGYVAYLIYFIFSSSMIKNGVIKKCKKNE